MNFSKLNPLKWFTKKNHVTDYLKKEFLELSMADGKAGLTTSDLIAVAQRIAAADIPDVTPQMKADSVETWVKGKFPNRISSWIVAKLVQLAFLYAKERGIIR